MQTCLAVETTNVEKEITSKQQHHGDQWISMILLSFGREAASFGKNHVQIFQTSPEWSVNQNKKVETPQPPCIQEGNLHHIICQPQHAQRNCCNDSNRQIVEVPSLLLAYISLTGAWSIKENCIKTCWNQSSHISTIHDRHLQNFNVCWISESWNLRVCYENLWEIRWEMNYRWIWKKNMSLSLKV